MRYNNKYDFRICWWYLLGIYFFIFSSTRWQWCCLACQVPDVDQVPECSYDPTGNNATSTTTGTTMKTTRALKDCLMTHYDRLCPPNGSSNVTAVSIIVLPINLIHVDDKAQQLNLHVYFALRWYDKRLAWTTPSTTTKKSAENATNTTVAGPHYTQLYFDSDLLWLPHIIIRERLYTTQESYFLKEMNLRVRQDGAITLYGYFVDKWACRMSTRLFPFDYQRCNLTLVTSQQVNLTYVDLYAKAKGDSSLFDSYINAGYDMGEWTLDIRAARGKLHQWNRYVKQWECTFFIYELGLLRDPVQHVLTWIIPPVITSLGAVLGLYLGCDPSERYSFGSAIVIALILMMIGLNDRLPVSDDGYPVLGMLYFSLCIIVTIASFLSTIPSNVRKRIALQDRHRNKFAHPLHQLAAHVVSHSQALSGIDPRQQRLHQHYGTNNGGVVSTGDDVPSNITNKRSSIAFLTPSSAPDGNHYGTRQRTKSMSAATALRFAARQRSCLALFILHGNNLDILLMSVSLGMEIIVIVMSTWQWMEATRS